MGGWVLMSTRFDCGDSAQRSAGLVEAVAALRNGELAVIPTDTVYGLAADAFSPAAVAALQAARGGARSAPPTVLVGSVRTAAALTESLGAFGQDLIDEFWPGALTLVFRASPTLVWDLGDTLGTVAVRMPLHPLALEVLRQPGRRAVCHDRRAGRGAARRCRRRLPGRRTVRGQRDIDDPRPDRDRAADAARGRGRRRRHPQGCPRDRSAGPERGPRQARRAASARGRRRGNRLLTRRRHA